MKNTMKFAKIVILTGCLVILGLSAAARGLEKMSPDISQGFLEVSSNNTIVTVTALGKEYHLNYIGALEKLSYLENHGEQWVEQCKKTAAFLGNMLEEKGRKYFPSILWSP